MISSLTIPHHHQHHHQHAVRLHKRQHNLSDYLGLALSTLTHITNFAIGAGSSLLRKKPRSSTGSTTTTAEVPDVDISTMMNRRDPLFGTIKKCVKGKVTNMKMSKHQAFEECMDEHYPGAGRVGVRTFYPWKIQREAEVGEKRRKTKKKKEEEGKEKEQEEVVIDVKAERMGYDDVVRVEKEENQQQRQQRKEEGDVFKVVAERVGRVLNEGAHRSSGPGLVGVPGMPVRMNMPGPVPVY
ncbi:MAG: hypothetical protein M1816_007124 [Peltula sp. TS41687]|nr:MAG: hypothetical protein M1816_007124 [Peltula sp. TS41687]